MDSNVQAMAAGVVTAAVVATGAIDADALAADAVAEIADGVWDETTSGHTTAGTTGKALTDAGGSGTPPTAVEVAAAVWDEPIDDHLSDRSFGMKIGIHLPVQIPDIDYRKIKEMVDKVVKKMDSLPQPEKVDLIPIVEGLHDITNEVRSLPRPKDPEKFDFAPILTKLDDLKKQVGSIEIPEPVEPNLGPILDKLESAPDDLKGLVGEIETILQNIRSFFSQDIEDIKGEVTSIKKELKKIPMVVMSAREEEND